MHPPLSPSLPRYQLAPELPIVSILFKSHQLLPGMRLGNCNYLLHLLISVLGRSETVVLRHAEGSARS